MCISFTHNKKFNKCNTVFNLVVLVVFFTIIINNFAFFGAINKNDCVRGEGANKTVEDELKKETEEILDGVDFSGIENAFNESDYNLKIFDGASFKEYVSKVVNGEETLSLKMFFDVILEEVKENFILILSPLLLILVVVLICDVFNVFKSGKISGVSEIIYFVCFSVIVVLLSKVVSEVIESSKFCIEKIGVQMDAVFPILLTLMTTMGGVLSVKSYTPIVLILSKIVSNVFIKILLPLFTLSLVLSIVGNLSENNKFTKLNGFVKSTFKWIIGVVFAVFMGFLSIKGLTVGAGDGLSIKATKYAIKNYIPMLGGYISEGFELVKAGSMLVKNATGFVSILLLFATIIGPVVVVGVLELGLKLLAGIIEGVGDKRSSNLLYSIAGSLKLLVVILVGVALMYFLTIFLMLCSVSNFI